MKFRKKPVVVEAVQYERGLKIEGADLRESPFVAGAFLLTPEGQFTVTPGDWIIKGVNGEFYPCKPDVFAATYEPEKPIDFPGDGRD